MIGSLYAILAAIFYALNAIFIRRAVLKVSDASLGTLISVPMAVPLFFIVLIFTGQVQGILNFSRQSYIWLSLAGVFHFVIGRSLAYKCVQLVGANISGILRRFNILVSVVIGIVVLREPLSWKLAIGVLFIISGITLAGFNPQLLRDSSGQLSKIPIKAYIFGFGNGLAWGVSPIFIKLGLKGAGSPIAGAFISFLAATIFLSVSLLNARRRISTADITGKAAVLFLIGGLLSFSANLVRYAALSMAPASVVAPLVSISPVFLLLFSFVFNRKLEIFSMPVIIGTVTVVVGGILIV